MTNIEYSVRKAYLTILNREPDGVGFKYFVDSGMAYNEICKVMTESKEFRKRISKKNDLPWPVGQCFVAKNIKTLFCPIAENVNTTIKRLMVELSDISSKEEILNGDIHTNTDFKNTGIQLSDLDMREVEEVLTSDSYFRFAVLRDPASRMLNAYWDKFVIGRLDEINLLSTKPAIDAIQKQKGGKVADLNAGVTFYDFVSYVTSQEPSGLDMHWRPQYTYLEGVNYDAFYSQNNLRPLYRKLSKRSGKKLSMSSENVSNRGKRKVVSNAFLMFPGELVKYGDIDKNSFFNEEIAQMIKSYFEMDFKLHNKCLK